MMAKNEIQFQNGYSLVEFFNDYGSEEQCQAELFQWKWPSGFICPECGAKSFCALQYRKNYHCHQTSGTIFSSTNLPLTYWFLAIHLITQSKTDLSALELKRQIGVSCNTTWRMKQKIVQVMKERDDSQALSGTIQLDDVYWGGELRGGKRGRGSKNKTPFVAAVSINKDGHPIAMNLNVVKGFRLKEISRWAKRHIEAGSIVYSNGLACFQR